MVGFQIKDNLEGNRANLHSIVHYTPTFWPQATIQFVHFST